MNTKLVATMLACAAMTASALVLTSGNAYAHCDTMNGPVVKAAEKALQSGNVNYVLVWVRKEDEPVIREAFGSATKVRNLGPEAKKLADMYFFETLVRIHRAGEGVAYTGLKPAETAVEPGIAAADEAVEKGTAKEMLQHFSEAVRAGLESSFTEVMAKKNYKPEDVNAGREYVHAYVKFIHYAEGIHQAASGKAGGHPGAVEEAAAEGHHH